MMLRRCHGFNSIAGKVQWARVKASVVLMVMLLASLSRVSPSDFPLSGRLSILV